MYLDQEDLARRLLAGDPSVLKELETDVWPVVRWRIEIRFAGRLRAADMRDLLQEALLVVWNSRAKYDPDRASIASWFAGIAFNKARELAGHDWVKQRQRETSMGQDEDNPFEPAAPACTNELGSEAQMRETGERVDLLGHVLADMRERRSQLLFAAYATNGYRPSAAELAEEFGGTADAVRQDLHRGVAQIVKAFDDAGLRPPPELSPPEQSAGGGVVRNISSEAVTPLPIYQ